jgi:hypothetical protein
VSTLCGQGGFEGGLGGPPKMSHFFLIFRVASIFMSIVGRFLAHGFCRWFSIFG